MTPFDIVLVPFPFSDLSSSKKRPCLVLATLKPKGLGEHCIVAMMTSNSSLLEFPGDVEVFNWNEAGLPRETTVRLAKVVTLDVNMVSKVIGSLTAKDQQLVRKQFRNVYQPLLSPQK